MAKQLVLRAERVVQQQETDLALLEKLDSEDAEDLHQAQTRANMAGASPAVLDAANMTVLYCTVPGVPVPRVQF